MELTNRETFRICGYAVETTAEQNDEDISALFKDFFDTGKDTALLRLNGGKKGYYGLSWYTQNHEKYCYLLGMEVGKENEPPQATLIKTLETTLFAVVRYTFDKDIKEAWNEFFYRDIPNMGYTPNAPYNLYFEYYPESVHGDYELWVPVIKSKV